MLSGMAELVENDIINGPRRRQNQPPGKAERIFYGAGARCPRQRGAATPVGVSPCGLDSSPEPGKGYSPLASCL